MTPKKKSKTKSRIIAALVAVMVLIPALLLTVSAANPLNIIRYNGTFNQPDENAAEQWNGIGEHNVAYQAVGDTEDFTFIWNDLLLPDDAAWTYACVQMTIYDDSDIPYGHYSIGVHRTEGGYMFIRLSKYIEVNGVWQIEYPYNERFEHPRIALSGFSIEKLTDGSSTVSLQFFGFEEDLLTIKQAGNASFVLPDFVDHVTFEAKTNYALQSGYIWDTTIDTPHTPLDLYNQANAYNNGESDVRESGEVIVNSVWKIISMPFDIVSNLLNFEIFGLNLWNTATAIITIALIVWVLKKVGVF